MICWILVLHHGHIHRTFLEDLTLLLDPVSKLRLSGYDLSFVLADLEARTFIEAYPKCSDFQKQFETLSQHTGDTRHPTFPDFSVRHGVLHLLDGIRSRVRVPTSLRGQLLETCHCDDSPLGGHVVAPHDHTHREIRGFV
jgi:hypothetical protein